MRGEWLTKDFYGILGVDPDSTAEEIKRAYRARHRSTHPDRHADDPTAEPLTKSINEAYGVLSDPTTRKEYDEHLREVAHAVRSRPDPPAGPPPSQPGQEQEATSWPDHAEPGADILISVSTPESLLANGGLVDLGIGYCEHCRGCGQLLHQGRVIACPACDRTGFTMQSPGLSVSVPAGLTGGSEIRYPGMGSRSREGGQSGDLVVRYDAVPDPPPPATPDPREAAPARTRGWLLAALGLTAAVALASAWALSAGSTTGEGPPTPVDSATPSPTATASGAPATTPSPMLDYSRYVNDRFGFAIDIPLSWVADPEALSGDGIVHRSPDGLGVLTVFGANNLDGDSLGAASEAAQQAILADDGLITYAVESGDYFTVSGYDADGDIFYRREWVGPGSSNSLWWTYPAVQKEQYDDLVNHVVESFTPGDLESTH